MASSPRIRAAKRSLANAIGAGILPPGGGPILKVLTVSAISGTVGSLFTATIGNRTAGSALSLTGAGAAGLSITGTTISGTPTTAGVVNVVETLAGAAGSPKITASLILVAASPRSLRYMFAATRLHVPNNFNTATSANNCRIVRIGFVTPDYEVRNLRFSICNWYNNAQSSPARETAPGNALSIDGAYVETLGGVFTQVTFNGGATTAVIADGESLLTDPLPGPFAAATKLFLRMADSVNAGEKRPAGAFIQGRNGEGVVLAATKQTALLTGGTITGTGGGVTPAFAVAQGNDGRSVALATGDSIGFGQADNGDTTDARGTYGFVGRGLDSATGGRIPFGMFCCPASAPSTQSSDALTDYGRKRAALAQVQALNAGNAYPFDHIVSEAGYNDSNNSTAAMQTAMQNWWAYLASVFPDAPIHQCTYGPRSTSTDNWTTIANQTALSPNNGSSGPRAALNALIRTKPSPLAGVIEVGPLLSDASDVYKWPVRIFSSTLAAAAAASAKTVSLAAAPDLGEVLVFEPGDASNADGAINYGVAEIAGTGPYTVTLSPTTGLAKAHASGTVVKATPTADGLHPASIMHVIAAQALVSYKGTAGLRGTAI